MNKKTIIFSVVLLLATFAHSQPTIQHSKKDFQVFAPDGTPYTVTANNVVLGNMEVLGIWVKNEADYESEVEKACAEIALTQWIYSQGGFDIYSEPMFRETFDFDSPESPLAKLNTEFCIQISTTVGSDIDMVCVWNKTWLDGKAQRATWIVR